MRILNQVFNSCVKRMTEIRTFIFLDTETTGLPYMENNRTKITELCMAAVEARHIRLGVFPRVLNKLSFCFNPWKLISADVEKITGLSNTLLEHQGKFCNETVTSINAFISHNPKPICFVAHNGDNFDYPILRREIEKTGNTLIDDIFCIDSIKAFKEIHYEEMKKDCDKSDCTPIEFTSMYDELLCEAVENEEISQKVLEAKKVNETTPKKQVVTMFPMTSMASSAKKIIIESPRLKVNSDISFKLGDVYTRLTKKRAINQHQAEGDVLMLIMCAATLGDKFVDWANLNAKNFCDIPPMVPGKKIGSC